MIPREAPETLSHNTLTLLRLFRTVEAAQDKAAPEQGAGAL